MLDVREPKTYIERFLKIKTKENRIVPFRLNSPQEKLYETIKGQRQAGKPVRVIILKARQMGFSTLTEGLLFHDSATRFNVTSMVVAHQEDSTNNVFSMAKLFYDELPEPLKPMRKSSNAQELSFENPTKDPEEKRREPGLRSKIRCVTAGGRGIARSFTLTNVHISEYAFWPGDKRAVLGGLLQAVPDLPGTMVVIESTANGYEDFKARWDAAVRGESDYEPLFFPWHEMAEYRRPVPPGTTWTREELELQRAYGLDGEQLSWRRWCIRNNCGGDERLFRQEYPASPDEAFLTTGQCVFDQEALVCWREQAPEPLERGEFRYDYDGLTLTNIGFSPRENGFIRLYEQPRAGVPYVVGGDTAGEGSDNFTAQVLDNTTGKLVATLCHQFDEGLYARDVYKRQRDGRAVPAPDV